MKALKRIKTSYYHAYGLCLREHEETDVDVAEALNKHKSSTIYKTVKILADAGAIRVTVSSAYHPHNKQLRCDIYSGYKK